MIITLPYPPSKLNPNQKAHWYPKGELARKYRFECKALAKSAITVADEEPGLRLKITFHPPDNRKRDRDNCIASFKAGQDGLADAWGVDDSQFSIEYAPLGEPVKGGKVVIET